MTHSDVSHAPIFSHHRRHHIVVIIYFQNIKIKDKTVKQLSTNALEEQEGQNVST